MSEPAGRPLSDRERDDVAERFGRIALAAGREIMDVYAGACIARAKADASPVTDADERAEAVILAALASDFADIPVVAEESAACGRIPEIGRRFILVDPLDGTREFIARNGEFTVNIALIDEGAPIAGVVFAPALGRIWLGGATASVCEAEPGGRLPPSRARKKIAARFPGAGGLVALCSRSHGDAETEAFLAGQTIAGRTSAGSSLKFCLIAEGGADVYPRFGPTMEWDIAAGDAVLRAAGGRVVDADGRLVRYGGAAQGFRNGAFIAWGRAA